MAKNTQRVRSITVTDKLTLASNAELRIRREGAEGYDVLFPASDNHAVLTTTRLIKASESGTHFVLNDADAFVSTLPALGVGLEYWFHVGATEPTTSHTVVTDGSDNVINGNLTSTDLNAASDVATVADADTISFIGSAALHGDFVHLYCDGSNWLIDGMCKAFDGMTTTQAS